MHSTNLEILAEAHHQLDQLPGVNPVPSATHSIREVAEEDPDAPAVVDRALERAQNASDPDDAAAAADLLSNVLSGTPYDPDTGEYYPD